MRWISRITVVAVFVSCGVARADLVLLGTISNTWDGTDPASIQEYLMGDRLLYETSSHPTWGDLFEDTRVLLLRDGPAVTITESLTAAGDPDFAVIAEWMTDGISTGDAGSEAFQEIRVLGLLGSEEIIDVHVDRISEFDLFGYQVERIDRHVTFSIRSPAGDPEAIGTEFRMGGVYEFWGSRVPEPGTLWLLGAGWVFLANRCSGKSDGQLSRRSN